MNEQNQRNSIMSMARGAFEERVDYEMDKVIQNILDPNTKATAKRKITLTIELTPDDERRTIGVQRHRLRPDHLSRRRQHADRLHLGRGAHQRRP